MLQGEELTKAKDLRQQGVKSQRTVRRPGGSSKMDKNINERREQQEGDEETILTMEPSASFCASYPILQGSMKR